ncbi:Integrase catalytic domain-containing protein, partial [Aphis craccivora]
MFTAFLTRNELDEALVTVVKSTKSLFYPELIRELKTQSVVHNKGLARLCPFLDDKLVIRVGGRLQNLNLRDDQKHPILLPKNCNLALLIASYWHVFAFRAGPRLMT